jgi:hypothetical protein
LVAEFPHFQVRALFCFPSYNFIISLPVPPVLQIICVLAVTYKLNVYILCGLFDIALWENNIKMDLKGFGWEDVDWIDLVPDRDNWRFL